VAGYALGVLPGAPPSWAAVDAHPLVPGHVPRCYTPPTILPRAMAPSQVRPAHAGAPARMRVPADSAFLAFLRGP
jgi:hypothetical protein